MSARVLRLPDLRLSQAVADPQVFPESILDAYRALVDKGDMTVAELAGRLDMSRSRAHAVVAELASLRLVSEAETGGLIAVPQGQAIDELLTEQARVLRDALDNVAEAQRKLRLLFSSRVALDAGDAERISSTSLGDTVDRGMFETPSEATTSLSALHPGGTFTQEFLDRSLARAKKILARKVRMNVVHQSSVLAHPSVVSYLRELESSGARVRLRDSLPFRLLLVDGEAAVCPEPDNGSFLMRGDRVMVLLNRVFETTWVDSLPLERALDREARCAEESGTESDSRPTPSAKLALAPVQEAILRSLAEGHTDQSIARSLGITTRTVTRRIREIYALLGVESRFQAGIAAQRLGIV